MNRTRKKYSVSGALDHSISPNDPSDTSNLKRLSSNILNYIKLKGNKYHNLSNKTKESKFNTNIEEIFFCNGVEVNVVFPYNQIDCVSDKNRHI